MTSRAERWTRVGVQTAFAVAVFVFWAMAYPFALGWQEHFQIFLFDAEFFVSRVVEPGGIAAWMAEFVVQFYNNPYLGATWIVALMLALQIISEQLISPDNQRFNLRFLCSFFIPTALWAVSGDDSVLPALMTSVRGALAAALIRAGSTTSLLVVALTYWMAGPVALITAIIFAERALRTRRIGLAVAQIALPFACIFLSTLIVPYPLMRLFRGLFYYRIISIYSYKILVANALIITVLVGAKCIVKEFNWRVTTMSAVALIGVSVATISQFFDELKYDIIEYDQLVRTQQWRAIVAKSERKKPTAPLSVCATNLALGMTMQLGDRAFEFFQRSSEGLVPTFDRDFASSQLIGEIYFHLGLVNTAQRMAFEAMEAIPDYRKSARTLKRLVETNIINGQYEVARKYLGILKKTMFYSKWAESRLQMLGNEEVINEHKVYGTMRRFRLEKDFLFHDKEADKIFGQLYNHCKDNTLAMQYLLMWPMLNADLEVFTRYYFYVNTPVHYTPRACQEALLIASVNGAQNVPTKNLVSDDVRRRFDNFMNIHAANQPKTSPRYDVHRNTFWYYLLKN